jgi:phosphoribosyl-AMP cyclohydrolase
MSKSYFKSIEDSAKGCQFNALTIINNLSFNEAGLIPVITQDVNSKTVLMMAWMSISALRESLETGFMTYWSRSRNTLWKKGEISGNLQSIREFKIDCDGDALLFLVDQTGPACHTGRQHCFYFSFEPETKSFVITS